MRPWDVLLVCIVCTSIVGYHLAKADQGSDFLDFKEEQVSSIANEAIANDKKKCELVGTCSNPGQCSRGGCNARLDDALECTSVLENMRCSDTPCNNIRVNYHRSYVRYPRYDYVNEVDSVSEEMRDSICSQRMLDPLFLSLLEEQRKRSANSSEDYYFNYFFGSVDGTFRFYPGLEVQDCFGFDPRIRPWYNGAFSVKKEIVVLLDTGFSMETIQGFTFQKKTVQTAEILAQNLVKTLTEKDRATVIGFDSLGTSNLAQIDVPDTGLNVSSPTFQDQLLRINITRAPAPLGPSDYTQALTKAISTFSDNSLDTLKIIVLFTDGISTIPSEAQLATAVQELTNQSIRLFIYEISGDKLDATACFLQGYHENLDPVNVLQNPLHSLRSYFTFLARSHIDAEGSNKTAVPFWQKVYTDYGNLGSIITVAFPAMSSDGHLIGVAGIDIQTKSLPQILQDQIEGSLRTRRNQISVNSKGVDFNNCTTELGAGNAICESSVSQPICVKDDNKHSYEDLICCGQCAVGSNPDSDSVVISVVVSLVSVLALAGGGLFLYFRFCRPRKKRPSLVDIVKVPKFSYEKLSLATNRFSDSNKLGHGTYGVVYVGTMETGLKVAVKKLHFKPDHDFKDFEAEIRVLATANHNNLVELKGFCVDQHYVLVYELVENGDLDDWLFEKPMKLGKVLPWAQRVIIARGTARGLAYLHEELQNQQKVCHSDIKPANILLDKEFNPKVADFGMAKLYDGISDGTYANGGTLGYMAPEVLNGAISSTKADVYSYGIVLIEMVTGRRFSEFKEQSLRYWANTKVIEGQEREIVDPLLKDLSEADHAMAKTMLGIALRCTTQDPDSRPDMSAVVKMIEGYLPVPVPLLVEEPHKGGLSSGSTSQADESFRWEGSWTMSQAILRFQGKGKGGKAGG